MNYITKYPNASGRQGAGRNVYMKYSNGFWHYRGLVYASLKAALLAAWQSGRS